MKALHTLILFLLAGTAYGQTVVNWNKDESNGCKVYNPAPVPEELVQITGNCVDGYLEGQGVVI